MGPALGFTHILAFPQELPACTRRMNPTFLQSLLSWHGSCSLSLCSS